MQNFASAGAGVPQEGQLRSSWAPQDMQNFAAAGLALPQVLQVLSIARNSSVREGVRLPTVIWVTPCT